MKFLIAFFTVFTISSCASTKVDKTIEGIYEVACGKCVFDMTGDDCQLAIKINDKYYYVEGSDIDDHGDEHAEDGLCNQNRKASVKGELKFGIFKAAYLKLIE